MNLTTSCMKFFAKNPFWIKYICVTQNCLIIELNRQQVKGHLPLFRQKYQSIVHWICSCFFATITASILIKSNYSDLMLLSWMLIFIIKWWNINFSVNVVLTHKVLKYFKVSLSNINFSVNIVYILFIVAPCILDSLNLLHTNKCTVILK